MTRHLSFAITLMTTGVLLISPTACALGKTPLDEGTAQK
jgi:hypothetical protein